MILVSQDRSYTIKMEANGYVQALFDEIYVNCTGHKINVGRYSSKDRVHQVLDELTEQMIAGVDVYRMPEF